MQSRVDRTNWLWGNNILPLLMNWRLFIKSGKCSNANHGLREGMSVLRDSLGNSFNTGKILMTTGDGDTQFHEKYLDALEVVYRQCGKNRETCIFQVRKSLFPWFILKTKDRLFNYPTCTIIVIISLLKITSFLLIFLQFLDFFKKFWLCFL